MKKIFALLLVAIMVLSLAACGKQEAKETEPEQENQSTEASLREFLVTVVYADGSEKDFIYKTTEEFIGPVLEKEGLIKTADRDGELVLTEVDGEKIEDFSTARWVVYDGDYLAEQSVDTTRIMDGRIYKIVYTPV